MQTNRKYIRKGIKMKETFSKYNSLIKKYGFINTLKKFYHILIQNLFL